MHLIYLYVLECLGQKVEVTGDFKSILYLLAWMSSYVCCMYAEDCKLYYV